MERVKQAFLVQQNPQSSPAQLKDANNWLEHFQSTQEAWQVADQLLSIPTQASDGALAATHVFAAQTMRTKIQYDWAELPEQSHESLRSSLLAHVLRFGQGPGPVLTQLCLAVATLALHMQAWRTVVPDLIHALTTPPAEAAAKLPCLLELLTVMPEEAENYKVGVLPKQREEFRNGLRSSGPQVMQLLTQIHGQFSSELGLMVRVLRCVSSWLRSCSLPTDQLASSPLLGFTFAAMKNSQLFDAAADMLVELVHFTHDYGEHGALIVIIVPQVLQLQSQYEEARSEDEDVARALCRLFTEMGEQYLQLLLTQMPDWAMNTAGAILRGAGHPDAEIAEITFNFWYVLSEEIAGGGRALNQDQRNECRGRFSEIFLRLLDALRSLAELPGDSHEWPADQKDDFKRFRYAVGDVISDACKVLSSKRCLESAFEALNQRLPIFATSPADHWRGVEACVFCMRQMISSNEPSFFNADVVSNMMRLLPTLPPVGELTTTSIRTVGTYANWLNKNPEMLPQQLSFVSQGLAQDSTAAAASQSMKHLCDACAEHLAEDATMGQLLQMYRGTIELPLHCADRVDLIAALSFVVSQMPLPRVLPAMTAIAEPLIIKMQAALENGANATEVANSLEQLCALLRGVSPSQTAATDNPEMQDALHPCIQMLTQLWQLLETVFARHGTDSRVMEKLCRCYKHTARNTGAAFKALVPRLLPQVSGWFETQPHSCFLYVCNVCLSSYGDAPELLSVFGEGFCRLSVATFQLLSVTSTIPDNPDVVDDYFELCSKVLRRQPSLLLESSLYSSSAPPLLLTVFQCGCAGLHIHHREAGRAVVNFFDCLVGLCQNSHSASLSPAGLAALHGVLSDHGGHLVKAIIHSIAGAVPQARIRFLVPVLRTLTGVNVSTCRAWVGTAIQTLPPEVHIDGATLLSALFSDEALADEKIFHQAIEAFSCACRRKRVL
mmetsp:Transcript_46187/g.76370  ORF Transcript_46187/g.76370 Transcript_46187/m.76370 type:complete len:952 (-) Transcript_46187:199-3054(-)